VRLGTLLLRDAVITLEQLEAALRSQVLFGGKLGTNLVELGHLTLEQLTIYLGKTLSFPPATEDRFAAADPAVLKKLDPSVAWSCVACPLGFEPDGALALAVADPSNAATLETLRTAVGGPIRPYVAPELRIEAFLDRVYPAPPGTVRASRSQPQRAKQAEPPSLPSAPPIPPPRVPRSIAAPPAQVPAPPWHDPRAARPAAQKSPTTTLPEALQRLAASGSRDEIGDEIVRFARGRVEALALFLVKDGRALGWKGFGGGEVPLDSVVVPIGSPSSPSPLARAVAERKPWRGRLEAHAIPEQLRNTMLAGETVIAPVVIGPHVVNLLYGCARVALEDGAVEALLSVVESAGEAYARLIQSAKSRG
jgi:hypothetical protein